MLKLLVCSLLLLSALVDSWRLSPKLLSLNRESIKLPKLPNSLDRESFKTPSLTASVIRKSLNIVGAIALSASLTVLSNSNAADLEASKLYAQAEQAIQTTQKKYADLQKEWGDAKKIVADNSKTYAKKSEEIKGIEKEFSRLSEVILGVSASSQINKAGLESEIENLKISTAEKFDIAAAAKESNAKLAIIQKLFKAAESEAALLSEDEKILKLYQDAVVNSNIALSLKAQQVFDDLKTVVSKTDDLQNDQIVGLQLLSDGLAKNVLACQSGGPECSSKEQDGVTVFKKGAVSIEKSLNKFSQVKKDFSADARAIQTLSSDLEKAALQLQGQITDTVAWEEETKLRTRLGKTVLKQSLDSVNQALKAAREANKRFETVSASFSGKDVKAFEEKEKKARDSLQRVLASLTAAENTGKSAGKLLLTAMEQGDKEAAQYRKFIAAKKTVVESSPIPAAAVPVKSSR